MTTNENPNDASKAERPSAGAGSDRPKSMKERLLAERKAQAPDAPPVPAARPAAAKPAPSPAAKPATSAAAAKPAPAAKPAAPAKPAPAARAAAASAESAPAKAPARASAGGTRARPAPAAAADPEHPHHHPDVQREINMLRARENKTMTIAWIATAVLLLAAGITWFVVTSKKQAEADRLQAQIDLLTNFRKKAESFDVNTKQGANDLVAFLNAGLYEGQKVDWQNSDVISSVLQGLVAKANGTVQRETDKEDFFLKLEQVESVTSNASAKTPDEVAAARRKIKLLEEKMDQYGDEAKKRIANCRLTIEKVYVERLWQDAREQSKDPAKLRAAMVAFASAEDACVGLFEKKVPDPTGELQKFGGEKMRQIYDESDAAAYQLFTPDAINKTEWTDCLAAGYADQWQNDQVGGFRIENGVMQIVGPEANSGKIGLASVPKKIQWRDFQVEIEFEVVKGRADFYFRLLRRADSAVPGPQIVSGSEEGQIPANKKVTLIATVIGSKVTYTWPGGELADQSEVPINWTKTRRGGVGIAVHPGSEIKVTKLRARLLRVDPN